MYLAATILSTRANLRTTTLSFYRMLCVVFRSGVGGVGFEPTVFSTRVPVLQTGRFSPLHTLPQVSITTLHHPRWHLIWSIRQVPNDGKQPSGEEGEGNSVVTVHIGMWWSGAESNRLTQTLLGTAPNGAYTSLNYSRLHHKKRTAHTRSVSGFPASAQARQ